MQSSDSTMNGSYSPEFKDFFIDELKDIYWAEKHLTKALPKMQKAATSEELRNALFLKEGDTYTPSAGDQARAAITAPNRTVRIALYSAITTPLEE